MSDRPPLVCASTKKASDCAAETNHFAPSTVHVPSPAGAAVVAVPARTSDPPPRSVSAMPMRAPSLPAAGTARGS